MKENKREERRYFAFTFSTAFLFFAMLFLSIAVFVHPSAEQVINTAPIDISEPYAPGADDSLTVLFLGLRAESELPGLYVLARFDPAGARVPVLALPPETAVMNNGKWEPLSEVYQYGGAGYTRDILKTSMGIEIDRYVKMDYESFLTAANAIGAVEFDMRESITLVRDGFAIQLSEGRQLLDGDRAGAVLAAGDGETENRLERSARLIADIVNQRMDITLSAVADDIFELVVNMVDTDISYVDYHDRKQAAMWLAEQGAEPAAGIVPSGSWNKTKNLFTISDAFLAEAALLFG